VIHADHCELLRDLYPDVFRRPRAAAFQFEYQGQEAYVAIADGAIIKGGLPRRAHAIVRQWTADHRAELEQNWANGQALLPLNRFAGANND
jgi:hypothetical protein